jgi:pimeloyl-ACP methyl ester carboxylesterase
MGFTYPERVTGIISLSGTARSAPPAFTEAFKAFQEAWIATPTPSEDLMNAAIKNWGGDLDVNSDRCKIIKCDWTKRYSGEAVVPITESTNGRDDIVAKLAGIRCPVLLVHGEKDATWTVEEAEIARDALPKAELKVIPESGHMVIFGRKSDDVSGYIEEFLKEQGY